MVVEIQNGRQKHKWYMWINTFDEIEMLLIIIFYFVIIFNSLIYLKTFIFVVHRRHHYSFWKRPFLPRKARVRRLPIWSPSTYRSLNTAHSGCKKSTSMSSSTHSHQVFLFLPWIPDAQTTALCHASVASPHPTHFVYPIDCTNPHCAFYPSTTLNTFISLSFLSRLGHANWLMVAA